MIINAYAKINLSLNILGQLPNGYHMLDMVNIPISLADTVSIFPRQDNIVNSKIVSGNDFVTNTIESDNAKAAGVLLTQVLGINGADIVIVKNIPLASGLGGSSADAVAVVRGLCMLNGISYQSDKVMELVSRIGADCPSMLHGGTVRAKGIGDNVLSINNKKTLFIVLASNLGGVDTRDCYLEWDTNKETHINTNDELVKYLEDSSPLDNRISKFIYNDLTSGAIRINRGIEGILDLISSTNPLAFNMSGSGSMCYGIYSNINDAELAYTKISPNVEYAKIVTTQTIE